ncbi:MAG: hypothetical protein V4649_16740 [Bacteroidota bacterium]
MNFRNRIKIAGAFTLLAILGMAARLSAHQNITSTRPKAGLKTTATGCQPAISAIDLDINNVRARLMTGGDMWWDLSKEVASYEVPKGSGRHSQFAASCWIGGFDRQGQLKVAAQTYRQDGNDYWPGALNNEGKITADTCALWDKFWKIDRSLVKRFIQNYKNGVDMAENPDFTTIFTWPAVGNRKVLASDGSSYLQLNAGNTYAPFKDLNNNGIYEPAEGEYPEIVGDQYIWWVSNDAGNVKQQSLTASMGIEVQTSAFAYATQDFLNNSTFCNYRVINRGSLTIDSTYIAVWDDCDLGYYLDDYIGCDTARGLGIMYNGTNDDGALGGYPSNSYGLNPPQVGLDFFQGPKRIKKREGGLPDTVEQLRMTNFTYYNNDASIIGNPNNGIQIYYYMTGSIRNGQRFANDFQGAGVPSRGYGQGPISNFVFTGDPGDNSQWSECACNNATGDRRFIFSSGPFELTAGAVNDITFGCVWAANAGGCGATTFKTIKNIDDGAQTLFDQNFKTVEGPEAPRLVIRELDRKLICYLVNDYGSNNYGENFGRVDGPYTDSLLYRQLAVKSKIANSNDSLYKFEGYRVFQLKNSQITAAEIFDPNTGEVDNTKATEVFQCDVANGVTQIVNYAKNTAVSDTTYVPQIKVKGKDSGIAHSFVLTQDQFATGSDKRFVNYHNYYFVAVAYAYNNFASFNPKNDIATQDVPYLGSSHAGGGLDIPVVAALPNPSNGAMGTSLNADYGDGVKITRMEGVGNGGNSVQITEESEEKILDNNVLGQLEYKAGEGPVNVKVIDPVRIPSYDWVLQLKGASAPATAGTGLNAATASWVLTAVDNNAAIDTIYSEGNLTTINEQIAEKYGISISVNQVLPPGADQKGDNGYITSSVTFEDPTKSWLRGVADQPDSNFANWLRSGSTTRFATTSGTNPCWFNDSKLDTASAYQDMLDNYTPTKSTWGPYPLAAHFFSGGHAGIGSQCGFEIAAYPGTTLKNLPNVDVVFTDKKEDWTRCAVVEMQEDPALAENSGAKFYLRKHKGWNIDFEGGSQPRYSDDAADQGMSWFPGYAVNQITGERLNIAFGEDSYLSGDNGRDMLWNPTPNYFNFFDNSIVFGGRHVVYVLDSRYDKCSTFVSQLRAASPTNTVLRTAYNSVQWTGIPLSSFNVPMKSAADGFIPTKTRLKFRVNSPYAPYHAVDSSVFTPVAGTTVEPGRKTNPYYTFTTKDLAPHVMTGGDTTNRSRLLSRIYAVPNPYYGYSGYEKANSRFDTKVRIINLPAKVTVDIYSLDGVLIRTLTKSDPEVPYIDWDIRNSVGLPIASGMYLMNVRAEGIGEKVIKWFGATRPLDVSTY